MASLDSDSDDYCYYNDAEYDTADDDDSFSVGATVGSESSNNDDADNGSQELGSQEDDGPLTKQYGKTGVTVHKANIVYEKVDVVVNSTTKTLDLKQGAASKSLLKKGGDSIQQECKDKYKGGLQPGQIAVTGSGSLRCKQIYHLYLPQWKDGETKKAIQNVMQECLKTASQAGHTSIAFPALGTGNLGYNKDYVAKSMFETVENFSNNNSSTSLTTVKFVLYPSDIDTIEVFTAACNKRLGIPIRKSSENGVKIGKISIEILTGSLAEQKTDVIMTSCTRGLDLSRGTLSKSLMDVGGSDLQTDLQGQYPNGIQHGEIAVVGPGKLKCKKFICGALPRYDKPENGADPIQILETLITNCLQQASTDKMTSISFPTLGTGHLKYPAHLSAKSMLECVNTFWKANTSTTLKTVNIVVFQSSKDNKTLQAFTKAVKSWKPPVAPKPKSSAAAPRRGTQEYCLHMYTAEIHPPLYWTAYTSNKTVKQWKIDETGNQQYKLVDVNQAVFNKIERLVIASWEPAKKGHGRDAKGLDVLEYSTLKVTKVQRLENLNLYEEYCNKKQYLFHKAAEGPLFTKLDSIEGIQHGCSKLDKYLDPVWKVQLHDELNEGYFFHGTKKDLVQGLLTQGLDPRLAQGSAVLGKAIYMAESSTKADQYTDSRDSPRLTKGLQMLLVRACLGKICLMKKVHKLSRPPCCESECEDDSCNHDDRYNSVVEEGKFIFREFVVYDRQQVYPEYVITYDRV